MHNPDYDSPPSFVEAYNCSDKVLRDTRIHFIIVFCYTIRVRSNPEEAASHATSNFIGEFLVDFVPLFQVLDSITRNVIWHSYCRQTFITACGSSVRLRVTKIDLIQSLLRIESHNVNRVQWPLTTTTLTGWTLTCSFLSSIILCCKESCKWDLNAVQKLKLYELLVLFCELIIIRMKKLY